MKIGSTLSKYLRIGTAALLATGISFAFLSPSCAERANTREWQKRKHYLAKEPKENYHTITRKKEALEKILNSSSEGKKILAGNSICGIAPAPDKKQTVFAAQQNNSSDYSLWHYVSETNELSCLVDGIKDFVIPSYWEDDHNVMVTTPAFSEILRSSEIYKFDTRQKEFKRITNSDSGFKTLFGYQILAGLFIGTLAFASLYFCDRKNRIKKGSLMPKSIAELVSLPFDAALKYPWCASFIAGGALTGHFSGPYKPNTIMHNPDMLKPAFYSYYYLTNLATFYWTTAFSRLFLDWIGLLKKPVLVNLPKATLYGLAGIVHTLRGNAAAAAASNKLSSETLEECSYRKLGCAKSALQSNIDEACCNLTKILEGKSAKDKLRPHLDPFMRIAYWLEEKVNSYTNKKLLQKNPAERLRVLVSSQQTAILHDMEDDAISLSDKIILELENREDKLPVLLNQAKIMEYYNRDSMPVWRQIFSALFEKYNFQKDFKTGGGTKSEVLEMKPETSISGANTTIIERGNDRSKLLRELQLEGYLSGILNTTPKPIALVDAHEISSSPSNFIKRYYLFMERKPGSPIDTKDRGFLEEHILDILKALAAYQAKATQNLGKLSIPLPYLNYKDYFAQKFLSRMPADRISINNLMRDSQPIFSYLNTRKRYFNHSNLHDKHILFDSAGISFIDSEDATMASFGIDLGFLANYLCFGDALIEPYYLLFGKKQGFKKGEFEKEAYSAALLATAHLVGRNRAYNEGREFEFATNLLELAGELPRFYPKDGAKLKGFAKNLAEVVA